MVRSTSIDLHSTTPTIGQVTDKLLVEFQNENPKVEVITAQCVPQFEQESIDALGSCSYTLLIVYREANPL